MVEKVWVLVRITGRVGNSETRIQGAFVDIHAVEDFLQRTYGLTEDELESTDRGGDLVEFKWFTQYSEHYATRVPVYN